MKYIQGSSRIDAILFPKHLDELVSKENDVRLIDFFVESIKLEDFKFKVKHSTEGRPAYNPKDLLKLYIYGYLNSMRSSRVLEKECYRNIEVMWLLKELAPDHNTISNFRRDNEKAIRKVFQSTVSIAKMFDLIGGKLIAGDSTKLRAQNSKKNNFNDKKIERQLAYIDAKLEAYNKEMADADEENKVKIQDLIEVQNSRKQNYKQLSEQLEQAGDTQISTSDPDSRQLIIRNNIAEVAYNVQTTVDSKYCIPIDYKVTNETDHNAMGGMLRRAKTILGHAEFVGLFDKGYHTGLEIKKACLLGVEPMVAVPELAKNAPDKNYNYDKFIYNEQNDTYSCPQAQTLMTNGRWYERKNRKSITLVKRYKTSHCKTCPAKHLCTNDPKERIIDRSEYAPYIEQNRRNIEANPLDYKKRQAIVEHPYGTIKRQWGFSYIMTKKSKKRASADVGLMFIAYNMRRLIKIIGRNDFIRYLKELFSIFFPKRSNMAHLAQIYELVFFIYFRHLLN